MMTSSNVEGRESDTMLFTLFTLLFTLSPQCPSRITLSKAMSDLRNWSTLPIIFLPAAHDTSLGILPEMGQERRWGGRKGVTTGG